MQKVFRMSCFQGYRPCTANKCTTCTSSEGIPIMTPSTRLCIKKLNAWRLHVVLFLALLSLQVHTCMQYAMFSKTQETRGEPMQRLQVHARTMHLRPLSVEQSVKTTYLLNPWLELQMSVLSRLSISTCKPQANMTWIDRPVQTGHLQHGQPGEAPNLYQVNAVEREHSQLRTRVTSRLEGRHYAMDTDLKPGPQTVRWLQDSSRTECTTARIALHTHAATFCMKSSIIRRGVPASAPSPRITCTCAPPAAHGVNSKANMQHSSAKPGTWKFTDDFIFQTGPLRTEAFACTCACILLHHVNHAEDKPNMMNAERAIYMKSIPVVLAEGLSRTEPLHFSQDRLFSKQVCTLPTRTAYKLHWVPLHAITPTTVLDVPTLLMAEAGEDAPAPPEGQLEAKPKRYPRSRVRADGTRRRTQAEIEARRKAKREGTGYWAGKGGEHSPSGRPASGPKAAGSGSRSDRPAGPKETGDKKPGPRGPSVARSSSRFNRVL